MNRPAALAAGTAANLLIVGAMIWVIGDAYHGHRPMYGELLNQLMSAILGVPWIVAWMVIGWRRHWAGRPHAMSALMIGFFGAILMMFAISVNRIPSP